MSDSPLNHVKEVFGTALGMASDDVGFYLDTACRDDPSTRLEVEALLNAHARAGQFLDPPANGDASRNLSAATTPYFARGVLLAEQLGSVIDRYRLLEPVGEGGFGIVFRAEQVYPVRRQVALKVIKLGMDTPQVIARFETERQALAIMDHPNIARVIDAGATKTGRPYFVMELVDGVPVTQFCDSRKLSIRRRLELFVRICEAVQHAHQKGVIHRDLKPSNILTTDLNGVATPKIIDFGIAKAISTPLTANVHYTDHRQLTGTPQYMSPEQADGNLGGGADTRSDVYSLGVVLYELLTGTTPLDPASLRNGDVEQTRRELRTRDFQKPSTRVASSAAPGQPNGNPGGSITADRSTQLPALVRLLSRDLDWVVMKAIEKDRTQRYETVAALAEDVGRFVAGRAVLAGPQSKMYHFRKIIARHRVSIVVGVAIVASLVAGLTLASVELVRARAAHREGLIQLFNSRVAQARAGRFSGRPGQRLNGLEALAEAARQDPTLEVRNEAIGCLALPDIEPVHRWEGRTDDLENITFDPALIHYARSDGEGKIRIYNAKDDRMLQTLAGSGSPPGRVFTFSPDGRFLVATYNTGPIGLQVWNLSAGQPVFRVTALLRQQRPVEFSPDGKLFAYPSEEDVVTIEDVESWSSRYTLKVGAPVYRIKFHPREQQLAVCSPGKGIHILDLATGAILRTIEESASISDLAWSDDGEQIASVGDDKRIHVWNARTLALQSVLEGHLSHPITVCFSHGGDTLASTALDGTLRLWDPFSGRQMLVIEDLPYVRFSPDDRHMVTTGSAFARVWNVTLNRVCRTLGGSISDEQNPSIDINPDGTLVAAANAFGVRLWELPSGHAAGWLDCPGVRSVFFSPDGKQLLAYSVAGMHQWSLPLPPGSNTESHVNFEKWSSRGPAAMSADGHTVVFNRSDGEILTADVTSLQLPVRLGHHVDTAHFLAVSPDGRLAASSRRADSSFKVWDVQQHRLTVELPSTSKALERGNVTFSPEGRFLVTSDPDFYRFWEVGSWKQHHELPRAFPSSFGYAAFSHNGKMMAIVSQKQDITLIEPESGRELATLSNPQPHEIECFCFSRDGKYLAVGNNDSTVTVWDIALIHRELATLHLDWISEDGIRS